MSISPIVRTFKYLGSLVNIKNYIQEGMKFTLKAGNSCYYSVKNLLSCRFLSKDLKLKINKKILRVVLYSFEAWSISLRG